MTRLFSVFGDSISTYEGFEPASGYAVFYQEENQRRAGISSPEQTWWMQVIRGFGGELLSNAAWSGSMVDGACYPCGNCDDRVADLARDGKTPDDILVYYGINDYGWGSADAQAAGRSFATPFCLFAGEAGGPGEEAVAGAAPVDAAERFGAAYSQMIARIRKAYPQARVWCFTMLPGRVRGKAASTFTYNFRGASFESYNAQIVAAAQQNGAVACDVASLGFDYEAIEGTHPTARGMRQMAKLMMCAMHRAQGEDAVLDAADFAGFESTNPCEAPGRACVDCPHAQSTGNQWTHVCMRA